MNLAEFRQLNGGLENLTDQEIVEFVAQSRGITPDNTPDYYDLVERSLGYDRSAGEIAKDTSLQLGQGFLNLGKSAASLFGAYDNPVSQRLGGFVDELEAHKSRGLQAKKAGGQINSDIARRRAEALGYDETGRFLSEAGAQIQNYWNAPGLLAEDFVTNAPQLLAGGVVGRGLNLAARGLGLTAKSASRIGVGGALGTSAALQGVDVGQDTYERAIQAGASEEQATQLANEAALKSGAMSLGVSLLPGASAIERRLAGGASGARFGLGRFGTGVRITGTEMASEGFEEGYGQFAGNESVQQVDPSIDLMGGVGQASVQGAAAAGPIAGFVGLTTPAQRRGLPRTETDDIDLAGKPLALPYSPTVFVDPTNVAQTSMPTEQEVAQRKFAPQPADPQPALTPLALPYNPTVFVDPTATAQQGMPTEQEVAQRKFRSTPAGTPPPDDTGSGGGGTPLALPYNPTIFVDPTATAQQGMPTEQEVARRKYAPQPADTDKQPANQAGERITRGDILREIAALKKTYTKKDGELRGNAPIAVKNILQAEDPLAAIRSEYNEGADPRDEFLNDLHTRLSGRTIETWRAEQQPADTNSAGFVPEPTEQVQAQLDAVREGRKGALVVGTEQVNELDLSGLSKATVTDPNTGESAVVVSKNRATVEQAAARAQEVGLKQALGEAQQVVDPTLTSRPNPPEGVVAVQQVDDETGQVLADEIVTPENVADVKPIPGATPRVVPADEPVKQRRAATSGTVPVATRQAIEAGKKKRQPRSFGEGIEVKKAPDGDWAVTVDGVSRYIYWTTDHGWQTSKPRPHTNGWIGDTKAEAVETVVRHIRDDIASGKEKPAIAPTPVNAVNSMPPAAKAAVEAGKKAKQPKKPKTPKFGNTPTEQLVDIANDTKDQTELDAAEFELYRRWTDNSDEAAEAYFLDDVKPSSKYGGSRAATFAATKRAKELQQRLDAQREAKGTEAAQKLGAKFGARLRATNSTPSSTMTHEQVVAILDEIKRTSPEAATVQVADAPADVTKEGYVVMGSTAPDGAITIYPSAMSSRMDVLRTVFHELFHRGMTFTPGYVKTLLDIAAKDALVRQYAAAWKASTDGQRTRSNMEQDGSMSGEAQKLYEAIAVDEGLAGLAAQLMAGRSVGRRTENSVVRTLAQWLADAADALGLRALAQWVRRQTYNDTEKFVMETLERSGTPGVPGPVATVRNAVASDTAPESPMLKPFSAAAKAAAAVRTQIAGREINPLLLKLLTLRQIDDQFGKKLPALKAWIGAVFERSSHASRLAAKADRVALKWEKAVRSRAEREALADVLLRASLAEVALDNTNPEYLARLDADQLAEHTALRQKLATLSPAAQAVRKEALDVMRDQWKYTHDSLVSFINHTIADPGLREERIRQMESEMGRNRGDYFPLSRFGDRVVIGRGAAKDGRDVISFHESAASADAEVQRLKKAGVKHIVSTFQTARDPRQRATTGFMGKLHAEINKADMAPSVRESMHEALQQLYLKSLPELSGAKHMIRRERVAGYSQDALRVFADAVTRGARYASHLDYGPRIQAAMEAAETQARSSDKREASVVISRKEGEAPVVQVVPKGTDRYTLVNKMMNDGYTVEYFDDAPETVRSSLEAKLEGATDAQLDGYVKQVENVVGRSSEGVEDLRAAKQLYNHMVNLQKTGAMEDPNKLTEVLGQAGYTWFLGFTPAFWLMNMLQNPMIGIPHLGAKYGVGKAGTEWGAAMRWFTNVRMGKLLSDSKTPFSVEWLKSQNLPGITKRELDMLQYLEDRQLLDFTQAMDLSRIGQATDGKWNKFMRLAAAGAHHTEVVNRVTFALAAYRLALKSDSKIDHDRAVQMAERDVAAVHFDYSYANKPEVMKGQVSRLIFMFQQYRQHMLYWWASTIKEAIKGESKEDRAIARKAAFLMGTTNALFAGALGMPFVGTVGFLLNMFGPEDDDGVPFDFERWVTEAAREATGSDQAGQIMSRGIFAALGMNIGQRIGQADLLPFLNEGSGRFERNADDKMRAFITDLLGPLGSIAVGAARSTEAFARGDTVAGLAQATPKVVADLLKSYQLGTEGVKNGRGQPLATQEAFDGADIFLQAAGVMPADVANVKADRGRVSEIDNAFKDKTRRLTGLFTEAWARQDRQGIADALEEIQQYNHKIATGKFRDRSFLIDGRKLESAIRDRQQRALILALTGGSADSKRQMLIALRMSGLINQVTPDSMREAASGLPGLPGF